jgi:hypothetical protein
MSDSACKERYQNVATTNMAMLRIFEVTTDKFSNFARDSVNWNCTKTWNF